MELLTYTVPTARFDWPDESTSVSSVTYSLNGAAPITLSPITAGDGYSTVKLPYQEADGSIQLNWTFAVTGSGSYTRTQYYEVVTPLLDAAEVRAILGQTATDDEVVAAEASARYIIQAYTGQRYGKYVGTISVTGSGETTLRLPQRLMSFTSINDNDIWPQWVALRGGGWYMVSLVVGPPSIRADFDGWHEDPNNGVITAPPRWAKNIVNFGSQVEYVIDGIWGWDFVPAPVVEAAKLLVNDFACGDSIYRDRFISSVAGPDWDIRFNDGAFTSTGNVRADQLLGEYKLRRGWMVV